MSKIQSLLGPMRLPFIILTPACVLLGLATAIRVVGSASSFHVILLLLGATSAHISVNAFNEYFDFRSGLDFKHSVSNKIRLESQIYKTRPCNFGRLANIVNF